MNRKHLIIMLLCCLIPLVALGAIYVFHIPVSIVGYAALLLICPLLHLLMMKFMMDGHSHSEEKGAPDYTGTSLPSTDHQH
jgi:hypothetical protein